MITNVSIVSVFVKDIDESLKFYTDVLGFEAGADVTLGDGYRWCTVFHPNQPELHLHLTTPGPPHGRRPGRRHPPRAGRGRACTASGVNVDDCQARPTRTSRPRAWSSSRSRRSGRTASRRCCRDNSGNWMVLVQHGVEPWRLRLATRARAVRVTHAGKDLAARQRLRGHICAVVAVSSCTTGCRGISRHRAAAPRHSPPAVIQAAK